MRVFHPRYIPLAPLALLLSIALSFTGCAPPPGATTAAPESYSVSRDGTIRYRLPAGWFDAGADTLAADRAVWLVRDDFAGSLTIRPVHLRAVDTGDLAGEGLLQVAKLTASLESSTKPGVVAREPDRTEVGGREAVSYDLEFRGSGDRTRTVLLASAGRIYAVTALVNGSAPPGAGKEIFALLGSFVAALRF